MKTISKIYFYLNLSKLHLFEAKILKNIYTVKCAFFMARWDLCFTYPTFHRNYFVLHWWSNNFFIYCGTCISKLYFPIQNYTIFVEITKDIQCLMQHNPYLACKFFIKSRFFVILFSDIVFIVDWKWSFRYALQLTFIIFHVSYIVNL